MISQKKTGKTKFSAAEITEAFNKKGSTNGAATGTIRRACELGLLKKIGYGEYEFNKNYDNHRNSCSCNIALRGIIQNAIDSVDRSFSASSLLQLNEEELGMVRYVLSSLNDIIKKL